MSKFCKYCGSAIEEGGSCNCNSVVQEMKVIQEPVQQQSVAQEPVTQEPVTQQNVNNSQASEPNQTMQQL